MHVEDIMSLSSNDVGYTKLIKMDIITDPKLPPVACRSYTLSLKHCKWARKEHEDLEKAGIIQKSISPYDSPIVKVPRKCPTNSLVWQTKRLYVNYKMFNAQLSTVHENKSSVTIALADMSKIDEMLAFLCKSRVCTSLDLRSDYYHIKLSPGTRHKSALPLFW